MATTVVALLLILLFQFAAAKTRWFWSLLRFNFASSPSITNSNNDTISHSFPSHLSRMSEMVSTLDLKSLIHDLNNDQDQLWDTVIDRRNNLVGYRAQCCKPKDGPLKYLSVTTFENCSVQMLRDFYMNNEYRKKWDKTFVEHEQLQVDESNGTEFGRIVKKFPLLMAREYILAWRVWKSKDGSYYCLSKECEHPLAPKLKKYVRVKFFRSGWCISKVPGRNASEIRMVHQENAGLNEAMTKLAFSKGIWSYVLEMDNALRRYSVASAPPSSLGVTAITFIQKVPMELDTLSNVSSRLDDAETSMAILSNTGAYGTRELSERQPSATAKKKLIANGLIVLGGVICMSRGHSNLGVKVALAYVLTKLSGKCGGSLSSRRSCRPNR